MDGTPVSGVEIRKAMVAPRPAPLRRMVIDNGTIPQEQMGSGTPSRDAVSTPRRREPPSQRTSRESGTKTRRMPAASSPIRK